MHKFKKYTAKIFSRYDRYLNDNYIKEVVYNMLWGYADCLYDSNEISKNEYTFIITKLNEFMNIE